VSTQEEQDQIIREAAVALARALTDGGEGYAVHFEYKDVTSLNDTQPRHAYIAHVDAVNKRTIV
jgi:hypothetical protein